MAEPDFRLNEYWEGKLEEWLSVLRAHDPDGGTRPSYTQTWCFPTDALRDEYLATIADRDEDDVRILLRWLLFDIGTFGRDDKNRAVFLEVLEHFPERYGPVLRESEYHRRLVRGEGPAHAGVRWALDLLPHFPRTALDAVNAYLLAHWDVLHDDRTHALEDAAAVIHAFYISRGVTEGLAALRTLTPRDFEILVARLYKRMGYTVELTQAQKDGGRDVVAVLSEPGRRQKLLIDCKLYTPPVGVEPARALLGIVSDEKATGGVIVTTGRVTKGVKDLARGNDRFGYVDGEALVPLLNEHFGANWHQRLGTHIRPFQEDGSAAG